LIIDRCGGFARDYKYRRKFELNRFLIAGQTASAYSQAAFWLIRLFLKFAKSRFAYTVLSKRLWVERETVFYPGLVSDRLWIEAWLVGYWQSPKYFEEFTEVLRAELMPTTSVAPKVIQMSSTIESTQESVAVGIRLYEESNRPADHGLNGRVKNFEEVRAAIDSLRCAKPDSRFFVFCTEHFDCLDQLGLPPETVFITSDEGYSDAVDTLSLIVKCKHHIFTNSSFYWWGAWLSRAVHKKDDQHIYAANNFINADGLCDDWKRF
jgi:hypothetical protein